jgi:hypothetical protein
MATKTHVETANLQAGSMFIPVGRYIIPGCPNDDILQKELDAGAPHIVVLGTVEDTSVSVDENTATASNAGTTGRRKPAVTIS